MLPWAVAISLLVLPRPNLHLVEAAATLEVAVVEEEDSMLGEEAMEAGEEQ